MSIVRIHSNEQYTAMSNHHLRDTSLSLQAMGLLSFMLSCSDKFKFSIEGLTKCTASGETATTSALKELKGKNYVVVSRKTDNKGKVLEWVYDIYEKPHVENPDLEFPDVENQGQRNNNISNNNESTLSKDKSLSKVTVSHQSGETTRFKKPTIEDIQAYCDEKGYTFIDAEEFYNYYESKGWMIGKSPMKKWKAAIVTWAKKHNERGIPTHGKSFEERRDAFYDKINALIPNYSNEYGREGAKRLLYAFYLRWAEKTPDGLYMRWETEKTFEFDKRLAMFIQDNGWKYKH